MPVFSKHNMLVFKYSARQYVAAEAETWPQATFSEKAKGQTEDFAFPVSP
jgi:hypothetical protein